MQIIIRKLKVYFKVKFLIQGSKRENKSCLLGRMVKNSQIRLFIQTRYTETSRYVYFVTSRDNCAVTQSSEQTFFINLKSELNLETSFYFCGKYYKFLSLG